MWKPGTRKPNSSFTALSSSTPKKEEKKNGRSKQGFGIDVGGGGNGFGTASTRTNTPSSATSRKRLSGGTMNMRFMKRRKGAMESESNDISEKSTSKSPAKNSFHERMRDKDAMDIEGNNCSSSETDCNDGSKYAQATSVDMYGMEASLIGRRSFRGFNTQIERIWKDSKSCLENRVVNHRPGGKISDEELLQRYQDIASQRTGGSGARGVGNLEKKNRNKKRR